MEGWKKDRIASALNGTNPTVLAKMKSGFAVLGDTQFLPGYCVLLSYPKAASLNELSASERAAFLADMTLIGDAITRALQPARVNYEILGNTDAFLHAHIFPRYGWEKDEYRKKPVWLYPPENWTMEKYRFDREEYAAVKGLIAGQLRELM